MAARHFLIAAVLAGADEKARVKLPAGDCEGVCGTWFSLFGRWRGRWSKHTTLSQVKVYYERVLPHWHPQEAWLSVTFCRFGALPVWKRAEQETAGEAFRDMDRLLDCGDSGPAWLKDIRLAAMVVDVLRIAQHEKCLCEIGGFVVMSNHVHLLMKPIAPAGNCMQWIKGVSARKANEILGRTGQPFWQRESYDRWVRTSDEYRRILRYIEWNPVKAGLVTEPGLWAWSSARTIYEQAKAYST
jgi:putative transposase